MNEPSSVPRAGEGQEGEDGADRALEAPEDPAPIGSHKPKETDPRLRPMAAPEPRAAKDAGDAARAAAAGGVR